jgi:hypothetical protein
VEGELGLGAGIDEDQRRLVRLDRLVDLVDGMQRHMPCPRQMRVRREDRDLRRRPGGADDPRDALAAGCEKWRQLVRPGDSGRKPDAPRLRRQRREPRHAERQQVAALAAGEGVQLVDDDAAQAAED